MRQIFLAVLAMMLSIWPVAGFAEQTLRIGVSLGLTGQYQQPALMHQRAYTLCQDEINVRGGILGRTLVFEIADDHSSVERAREIYRRYMEDGSVDFVFGPYSSDLTKAVAPITEEYGYPMLAAGAAADSLWSKGYTMPVGVLIPASRYTLGMMRLASESGLSTIALVHAQDDFSREIAAGTRRWARYVKLKVVYDQALVADGATDASNARAISKTGAEVVIVTGYFGEAKRMRQALRDSGWEPRAFFATVGPSLPSWELELGELADLAFSTSIWEPPAPGATGVSAAFAKAFHNRFGEMPSYHAAAAYAACQVFEAAILKSGSFDRAGYRRALGELDINTVIGRFAVDSKGMQTKGLDMVIQWIDGSKQVVWPSELSTRAAVFSKSQP